jgi:hypothetical protein
MRVRQKPQGCGQRRYPESPSTRVPSFVWRRRVDWGPIDKLVTIVISIGRERATTLPPQPAYRDRLGFMTGRYCKLDAGVSVDLSG